MPFPSAQQLPRRWKCCAMGERPVLGSRARAMNQLENVSFGPSMLMNVPSLGNLFPCIQ